MTLAISVAPQPESANVLPMGMVMELMETQVVTWGEHAVPPEDSMPRFPILFDVTVMNEPTALKFWGYLKIVEIKVRNAQMGEQMFIITPYIDELYCALCNKYFKWDLDPKNRMHVYRARGTLSIQSSLKGLALEDAIREEMIRYIALTLRQKPF